MKILLSAFACRPNSGSETGVGWRWAIELAKQHNVVVLTDVTRKVDIEAELATISTKSLKFEYYRTTWLKWVPLNSKTAQLLYSAWQYSLLPFALQLHRKHQFDLIIHLTYGVFRHPSFLGFVGAPFVFGPVGGGEDAPWRLKRSLPFSVKVKEFIRWQMNHIASWNPFLWLALSKADCIFVRTPETAKLLPMFARSRAIQYQEIGIDLPAKLGKVKRRDLTQPLSLLFVGRLLGLKGVHLAIRALSQVVANGVDVRLTIVGTGSIKAFLDSVAASVGIQERTDWIEHVPQEQLLQKYAEFDAFLFPSLHDSGGNVVLEAMAGGLPIICLDIGGPATLVNVDCAMVISTDHADEAVVVSRLADAITMLATNEEKRMLMSTAALKCVREMSWESRVSGALGIIKSRLIK